MKKTISIVLLFLILLNANAQKIQGKVVSEQNTPLSNVNVYLKNSKIGTSTDKNGYFAILTQKSVKQDTVCFSMVGYFYVEMSIPKFKSNNVIKLYPKSESLNEVTITKRRKLKPTLSFEKVTTLQKNVFAFDSNIIDNNIYISGGDNSYKVDIAKKAQQKSNGIGSVNELFSLMRRYNEPSSNKYSNKLQIYDLNTNKWLKNKVKLDNRAYHNTNYYNGNLYLLGGKRMSKNGKYTYLNEKIEIVNLDSLTTKIDYTNPHKVINFASTIYKGRLVVMGGSFKKKANKASSYSNKSYFYNMDSGLWYPLPDMPKGKETQGVLIGDKFYLIGGYNGRAIATIESFNFISGIWKKERNLPRKVSSPALTTHKSKIYIYDIGNILVYDTLDNTLKKYSIRLDVIAPKMHFYNGSLYIIGGFIEDNYSKKPSSSIYKINTMQLGNTKFSNIN